MSLPYNLLPAYFYSQFIILLAIFHLKRLQGCKNMSTIEYILITPTSYLFSLIRLANHSPFVFALAWVLVVIIHFPMPNVTNNIQQLTLTGVPDTTNKGSQGHGSDIMNIFSNLRVYAGKWAVVESKAFSQEEQDLVSHAEVVDSQYGMSVCFFMKAGGQTFIPLSVNSSLSVGDAVDLSKAKVLQLHRDGDADIYRVEI